MGQGPSTSSTRRDDTGAASWGVSTSGGVQQSVGGPMLSPLSVATVNQPANMQAQGMTSPRTTPAEVPQAPAPTAPAPVLSPANTSIPPGASGISNPAPPQPRTANAHKSTTLIPCWSRPFSSQQLQVECQKIVQPMRASAAKDSFGVLEMEVMKFVAYCGGVTVRFRVDELQYGPVENVSWGLASTRACPALLNSQLQLNQSAAGSFSGPAGGISLSSPTPTPSSPGGSRLARGSPAGLSSPGASCGPGNLCGSNPTVPVSVDSHSRRPLYMLCTTTSADALNTGDIMTIDLAPKEDKQPVLVATLRLNDQIVLQQSLPCNSISSLQLYPFVTVNSGMSVSLHEAVTPSPLFTWYQTSSSQNEVTLAELDTCIKYHTQPHTPPVLHNGSGVAVEFTGSTVFTSGRHRWTVQLDNFSTTPTHILVGVAQSIDSHATLSNNSNILANVQGPLRSIAGTSNQSSQQLGGARAGAGPSSSLDVSTQGNGGAGPSTSLAAAGNTPAVMPGQANKWGAWIRLPGTLPGGQAVSLVPPPPRGGLIHTSESTSSYSFVTVDLDLANGTVRFYRNGHPVGTAFTGLRGPISPIVSFVQAPSLSCQAGLVNLTKLRQLDLSWNAEKCSGDLRLSGMVVSKFSEVYGDYSTVLASQGFISGVHLWLIKVNNLSEPDSIFIGVCRGCMPLDQDPQDLRDRTYYLSNGVIRVGGRRAAANSAQFTKGDVVGVVLDADQGEIVFFRNGVEQGRARGIRGRLYPFVSCDSEGDQITLLGSYSLLLDRIPRQLADMEWDTLNHADDIELSSNCLTATKTAFNAPSTVRGTILYTGSGCHEYHVILDTLGPDGVWIGVAPPDINPSSIVGDPGCGWALHSDGDKRFDGRDEEFTQPFKSGDVLTVCVDMGRGILRINRNGQPLGEAFTGLTGPLVSAITLASEESKVTIQNRPTVLNTGEYTGDLRWDEARAGKDLHVIDGLTVTKMANDGGDYATVLGTICLASGQHSWNIYINHVEDSNLFIGVAVGGHDLNADPQEMKHRTYYLSNGTIRVAGKLITRCAEPYAEGDLVSVNLDMELRHIQFLKNGVLQGAADGLPEEVWPYVSLDNIMDSITLHSSGMFADLLHSLRWNPAKACKMVSLAENSSQAQLRAINGDETSGQGTVLGLREYSKNEVHSWTVRFEQSASLPPANFLVGVAPPTMDLNKSLGEDGCGIGLDYFGYFYVNGRYFHVSNLNNWAAVAKPVRGSTAKHKGKAQPIFTFTEGKCEVTLTLDLKEGTLKFTHGCRNIGTVAGVRAPLHAAVTLTNSRQVAVISPGPIGNAEHTNEELVNTLKAKGCIISARLEAALLLIPRDLFVPRDRHREAFRDQKITVRMTDGSTMTLPPPSFVATAMEKLNVGVGCRTFLDVGCGTGYVSALAACLIGDAPSSMVLGIECVSSRLEAARGTMRQLRERLTGPLPAGLEVLGDPVKVLGNVELSLSNVLIPECTDGQTFDALYCDASLSEEDLPMFLSLLKPNGRMVVIIDEEAVLVTRSNQDPHDFTRELICHVPGDFGELEDPTPWEVQDAILRIKERERKKGFDQAKQDIAALRSFEYVEMQQRVQAAMQRIGELEAMLQRTEFNPMLRSPVRSIGLVPGCDPGLRSPARSNALDDVRGAGKDKSRRGASALKPSPRGSNGLHSPLSGLDEAGDWRAMYTTGLEMGQSSARARAKELLAEPDQVTLTIPEAEAESSESDEVVTAHGATGTPVSFSTPLTAGNLAAHLDNQVSISQTALDDIIDGMSVQTFSPDQIAVMIAGSEAVQIENRDVFHGTFKGVKVRVWRVSVGQGVSYLDLKRAYSRYCIAHPNIAAVLGVCIQPSSATPVPHVMMGGHDRGADVMVPPSPVPPSANGGRFTPTIQIDQDTMPQLAHELPSTPAASSRSFLNAGMMQSHTLWVVEESFGEESLHTRLERGLLSWQQVCRIAKDMCKALAFLQDLRRHSSNAAATDAAAWADASSDTEDAGPSEYMGFSASVSSTQPTAMMLSAYALRTIVTPSNVHLDAQSTKVSVLPALLHHLEAVLCDPCCAPMVPPMTPMHCDMAYIDPFSILSESSTPSFYALGIVLLQLLTEQGPLGLLSAVKEALDTNTLHNLTPRLPSNAAMHTWSASFAAMALKCTQPSSLVTVEVELLPMLAELEGKLATLGSASMSWEQVEEMLTLPLQPRPNNADASTKRWVGPDFRFRRKNFLEEVAKLAVEGPVHKIEVRRTRCFKDSVAVFAGKGHAVWRQPLKVTFIGEAGMDSGGVTREWFSSLSSAISRGSPELFWPAGPQRNQLYVNPLSSTPSHLKKFHFVGLFMAKAILESAARGKELGPVTLNLPFCEPLWKLLLGIPLNLMDLQQMDPTELRSLMSILDMDIDGLIFETFSWSFHHNSTAVSGAMGSTQAGFGVGAGYVAPSGPSASSTASLTPALSTALTAEVGEVSTPTGAQIMAGGANTSPFAVGNDGEDNLVASIPLKPGGTHIKVTNHNKREYVLLKAHKMLVGTVEAQMTALIDAFHSVIPRDLVDRYSFTSQEMALLVCGEQRIDVQDLKRHCKYEDGYTGKEEIINWFWDVLEGLDDAHRRHLLQFWSGSDGMPAEGFGALDPAFHIVAVERMYDANDTTARLPAAHTCFRQLDLPRYRSPHELRDKLVTAITIGQGYMALS